eukprot:3321362-Pyramimonas_sp.AAC.1
MNFDPGENPAGALKRIFVASSAYEIPPTPPARECRRRSGRHALGSRRWKQTFWMRCWIAPA